jgi:tetratricopeptide (TPR) repeat protein
LTAAGIAWGVLITVLGLLGWSAIRRGVVKKVSDSAKNDTNVLVREATDRLSERLLSLEEQFKDNLTQSIRRVEEELLDLAPVVILRYQGRYEDALTSVGWDGNWATFSQKPAVFQRAIIECLAHTKAKYKQGSFAAWEAAQQLVKEHPNVQSLTMLLRTAVHLRKFEEAKENYDYYAEKIDLSDEIECHQLMLVVYRRLNDLESALEMAERVEAIASESGEVRQTTVRSNITYVNNYAALLRDFGEFNDAHDLIVREVMRLVQIEPGHLPDGWHRILNTYMANCIDRFRPQDGIEAVHFALRMNYDTTHLHTSLRLARALREDGEEGEDRLAIVQRVERNLVEMPASPSKSQTKALLLSMKGATDEAVQELERIVKGMAKNSRELYFAECMIGQVLIDGGKFQEAVDRLHRTAQQSNIFGGEACFLLARAFALPTDEDQDLDEAARWLERSIELAPKWRARARDTPEFRRHEQLLRVLEDS